jgi:hypothetical protein
MPSVRPILITLIIAACGGGRAASPAASDAPDAAPPDASAIDTGVAGISAAERGAAFVRARGCAGCHQSDDPADGVLSGRTTPFAGTDAYGANLTPDVETGLGGWSDDAVTDAIRTGVDDEGIALCAPMPHFRDMTDEEARAIVAYLRALPPVNRDIPASVCPEEDDAPDAGSDGPSDGPACDGWAPPTTAAACHACGVGECQPNGCFGGFWCDVTQRRCHPPPPC